MPKFHFEVETADAQDRLLAMFRTMDSELSRAIQELGDDAVLIMHAHAPTGASGRLGRGIRAISTQGRGSGGRFGSGRVVAIVASARNPIDGFDYVGVSRFGHRVQLIEPRHDRRQATVISTRAARRTATDPRGRPALRIPARVFGNKPLYRNTVEPVRKTEDWASEGVMEMRREVRHRSQQLGRRLEWVRR